MSTVIVGSTGIREESVDDRSPPWWVDMKSRMNREIHVRDCEGLGVRFPRATRLNLIQALVWNVGTCRPDAKGEAQVGSTHEAESARCGAQGRTDPQ